MPLLAEEKWEKVKSANGIEVYFGAYEDSKIPQFRATTIIETSLSAILGVLRDTESCPQWVHQCRLGVLLQDVNEFERYVYQINALPFPFRGRDLIVLARLEVIEKDREYRISVQAAPDFCRNKRIAACAPTRSNRYVRILEMTGNYHLEKLPNSKVKLVWQQYIDPALSLPRWLVTSQLKSIPFKTIENLRELVTQEKYQQADELPD